MSGTQWFIATMTGEFLLFIAVAMIWGKR